MSVEDRLRTELREEADRAQPSSDAWNRIAAGAASTGVARSRRPLVVVAAAAVVVILAAAAVTLGRAPTRHATPLAPNTVTPPPDLITAEACPGQRRLDGKSEGDLVQMGAADGLPEQGATTEASVRQALDRYRDSLRARYPGAEVGIGRGIGWTYSMRGGTPQYHRGDDYAVVVVFPSAAQCRSTREFTTNGFNQRIPVILLHR